MFFTIVCPSGLPSLLKGLDQLAVQQLQNILHPTQKSEHPLASAALASLKETVMDKVLRPVHVLWISFQERPAFISALIPRVTNSLQTTAGGALGVLALVVTQVTQSMWHDRGMLGYCMISMKSILWPGEDCEYPSNPRLVLWLTATASIFLESSGQKVKNFMIDIKTF